MAKNPFIAAKFFNIIMDNFFKIILGQLPGGDKSNGGILGHCKGYYGCVEAQGRGTLHCHIVVWLEGALNPQEIKDRVLADGDTTFLDRLLNYLDDTIHTHVPDVPSDPDISVASDKAHPASVRTDLNNNPTEREKDRRNLVSKCQKHFHTGTCFKYWSGPPEPKICRFELSEDNFVPKTSMNMETGELEFRALNGMINNYCMEILEALRCNMDIKFIGSGASAKAILYYITDYITKSPLKADVAYTALRSAIAKLEQYEAHSSEALSEVDRALKLLVKCANAIISKQELSGQQVAAYLSGFGDHYTSHSFRTLFWPAFVSYVAAQEDEQIRGASSRGDIQRDTSAFTGRKNTALSGSEESDSSDSNSDSDDDDAESGVNHKVVNPLDDGSQLEPSYDEVILEKGPLGDVRARANQCMDYCYRGDSLDSICLWDFVAEVEKLTISKLRRDRPKWCRLHLRKFCLKYHHLKATCPEMRMTLGV